MDIGLFAFHKDELKLIGLQGGYVDTICYITNWGVILLAGRI